MSLQKLKKFADECKNAVKYDAKRTICYCPVINVMVTYDYDNPKIHGWVHRTINTDDRGRNIGWHCSQSAK